MQQASDRHWTNRGRQKSKSKVAHTGNRKQRTSWSASPPVLASKVGGFSAGVDSPAAHPAASSFFWSIGAKNLKKTSVCEKLKQKKASQPPSPLHALSQVSLGLGLDENLLLDDHQTR